MHIGKTNSSMNCFLRSTTWHSLAPVRIAFSSMPSSSRAPWPTSATQAMTSQP